MKKEQDKVSHRNVRDFAVQSYKFLSYGYATRNRMMSPTLFSSVHDTCTADNYRHKSESAKLEDFFCIQQKSQGDVYYNATA